MGPLWKDIDTNWQRVETQLRHLQWILDTALPGELGIIGEWVNQGEAFLTSDDEPAQFNEDSAALLNQKIDDHKQFFENYERTMEQLKQWTAKAGPDVQAEQLQSLVKRLHSIGPKACKRGFHLKFLEHKCCILAFLNLTESKLRTWTRKCGSEENVVHVLSQYKAFVSKNKIFQEFHKAFLEFKDVSEDYKNNANIAVHERMQIDKFIDEVSQKWSMISTELQHVQAHLNEVLTNWQQWNSSYAAMETYLNEAFDRFEGDEAQIQHFLEDLDQWKMHYSMLQTTSSLLMNTCDENIASNLQQKMAVIHCNWSYLLQYAEKYGSDTLNRATFDEELKQLEIWLTKAFTSVSVIRKFNRSEVQEGLDEVTVLNDQVVKMETLFKSLSRRFQALVSEMAMPEIEDTMKILKRHKEQLVNVR
jgi:nesprin-1